MNTNWLIFNNDNELSKNFIKYSKRENGKRLYGGIISAAQVKVYT